MLLGWGINLGECGRRPGDHTSAPAGADAIADFTIVAGADGELTYTIGTAPDAGDGAAAGDGLGTITEYQWRPADYPVWFDLGASIGAFTLGLPLLAGETLDIEIRALGYAGRGGAITTVTRTVPGAALMPLWLYGDNDEPLYGDDDKRLFVLIPAD
jgi:hypothetical protein